MTTEPAALDTTAWWEIVAGSPVGERLHQRYVESDVKLYASALVLGELTARIADPARAQEAVAAVRSAATIVPVSGELAQAGGQLRAHLRKADPSASLADGIHLATARSVDAKLVSNDAAFACEKDVVWPSGR